MNTAVIPRINSPSDRFRILMVLTRRIPAAPKSGRERTLNFIERSFAVNSDVAHFELLSLIQKPGAMRVFKVLLRLLRGLLQKQPCPLQVALFFNGSDFSSLFRAIEDARADAIYFDSVRTADWLVATRAKYPRLRLICDFDDLMSLRFSNLLERNLPISLGYLESVTPRWLREILKRGSVTRRVLAYETRALRQTEKQAVAAADAVSVVSATDIKRMRADVGPEFAAKTLVIPPGINFPTSHIITRGCREFIFVGSDALLQNRLTIDFLLELWSSCAPAIPLRMVGRMSNSYHACPGVTFTGFVNDLSEIYGDEVIALCPSFIEGGIKTKVLEALGYGVIPVGNSLTFEGIGCDAGLLAMTSEDIRVFVSNPDPWIESLRSAASRLREYVHSRYSFEAVTEAWSQVVTGSRLAIACG